MYKITKYIVLQINSFRQNHCDISIENSDIIINNIMN